MKKGILKELTFYALMLITLVMLSLSLSSCSKEEYTNEAFSGKRTDRYKVVGYNIAIQVMERSENTIEAKMIWNEVKPDEVDCQSYILDARILSQYEKCPYCPNLCD